jgi:hypothetical protein
MISIVRQAFEEELMERKAGPKTGRRLIYIPIIHTETDMGSLGEPIRHAVLQKLGKHSLKRKTAFTSELWNRIEKKLEGMDLSFDKVRLYQDGLPVCGRESEIVSSLAGQGSLNHRILFRLMEKGATLTGTESSELLLKEYTRLKQNPARGLGLASPVSPASAGRAGTGGDGSSMEESSEDLLWKRDRYIARRISETLQEGETGILFLGMLHSLEGMLDRDIQVLYPMHRPLSR